MVIKSHMAIKMSTLKTIDDFFIAFVYSLKMGLQGNNAGTYFAFSMIVILSALGNMLVLGVMLLKRDALKKPYNIFICSLACTDIITAIFLTFSRYLYLPDMPENELAATLFCSTIWNACILFGLGYVSIYTCLVLTIERWLAIVKPSTYRKTKPKHAVAVVAFVWFWGLLIQATTLFRAKPDYEEGLNNSFVYPKNALFPYKYTFMQNVDKPCREKN